MQQFYEYVLSIIQAEFSEPIKELFYLSYVMLGFIDVLQFSHHFLKN